MSASRPMSEDDMSVDDHIDTAAADPLVATPDIEHELEMLQGAPTCNVYSEQTSPKCFGPWRF